MTKRSNIENRSHWQDLDKKIDNDIELILTGGTVKRVDETPFRKELVYDRLMERITSKQRFSWVKVAAVLIPLFVLNITALFYFNRQDAPVYSDLYTPCGEQITVILPDGTKVWLNADTKLKYPNRFEGKERKVYVEGEAYFDVTKDKDCPFIVEADNMQIEVLGTAFNVKAYPELKDVITTLDEGSVNIRNLKDQKVVCAMKPGEVVHYAKLDGQYRIHHNMNHIVSSGWKRNQLIFNNTPLEEVLSTLRRKFNQEFVIADAKLKSLTYTIAYREESLEQILEGLERITPVKHKIENNRIIIHSAK